MKRLKLFFACLLMAVLSIGQVWGADPDPVKSTFTKATTPENDKVTDLAGVVTWDITTGDAVGSPTVGTGKYSGTESLLFGSSGSNYFKTYTLSTDYFKDYNVTSVKIYVRNNGSKKGTLTATQGSVNIGSVTHSANTSAWGDLTVNTNKGAGGTLSVSYSVAQASYLSYIEVTYEAGGSSKPTISTNPISANYAVSATATALSVGATASAGDLHYQWKSNTTNSTEGATNVGTDAATYTPSTASAGTTYYFCVVSDDNGSVNSSIAAIKVASAQTISAIMPSDTDEGDEFLLNDVTVTYAYSNYTYVKDATGYMLVFSSISGAANGKVLQGLWGKAKLYSGLPEISTVTKDPNVTDGSTVAPIALEAYPVDADLNKYVTLEGVTFASAATLSGSVTNVTGSFKGSDLVIRNTFKLDGVSLATGKSYQVVGIVQKYNSNYQIFPISFEEISDPDKVATPTFDPAGGEYDEAQSVTVACETEGATIYYTIDGTDPSTSSSVYSSAIDVSETTTIKAFAVKGGYTNSDIASATYTITTGGGEDPDNTVTFDYADYKGQGTGSSGSEYTMVKADVSIGDTKFYGNNGQAHFYASGVTTITPAIGVTIKEIVLTATEAGYNGYQSSGTVTASTGSLSHSGAVVTWTGSADAAFTISHNKQIRWYTIVVTYEKEEGVPVLAVNPTTIDFGDVEQGETVDAKKVAVNFANLTGAVTYSGLTSPFSASGSISDTGDEITISADASEAGEYEQTLTVTSAADSKSATVTVTMNVLPAATGDVYNKLTGSIEEGDYVIFYNGKALKNTIASSRFEYAEVTPVNDKISDPDPSIVWSISQSGEYWTIYNENVSKYAGATGSNNQGALLNEVGDKALWSISGTGEFDITNKYQADNSKNAYLRGNGTYGFACYAEGTGGKLILYKAVNSKAPAGLAYETTIVEKLVGAEKFTNAITNDNNLTVAYVSSNTSVATVDAESGEVTIVAAGVAEITASTLGDDTHKAGSTKYTICVTAKAGSQADPYTVADAKIVIDALGTKENVYASGIISKVDAIDLTENFDATYWISVNGLEEGQQLEAFHGKYLDNANFASEDDIKVGDEVVIYGNLKKYGTSIYEFDGGNYLMSLSRTKVAAGLAYAVASVDKEVGDAKFTNELTNPHNVTVAYSSSDPNVASVDAATGEVTVKAMGSATITATFDGDKSYLPGSASYTVNVSDPSITKVTFVATEDIAASGELELSKSNVTLEFSKGVMDNGTSYRLYKDAVMTLTCADGLIVRVELEGNDGSYPISNISGSGYSAGVWTGSAESVELEATEGQTRISKVNVYYQADNREVAGLAYATTSVEKNEGDAKFTNELTNPNSVTVAYSSSDASVASVDAETGEVTINAAGEATITASFAGNATYKSASVSYSITVSAAVVPTTGTTYRKVTATEDITDGEYLIVYEGDNTHDAYAFNGSLENIDQAKVGVAVTINEGVIAGTTDIDAAVFTINVTAGTLQSASGWYIGRETNSNGMDKSTETAYVNTFAITEGKAVITGASGCTLRYNYASDQLRFRYYTSGQRDIQLYKKEAAPEPVLDWEDGRTGLTAGNYYTICLPKEVTHFRGATIWDLKKRNTAGSEVYLEEAQLPFAAGTPFIIQATADKLEVVYEGDATSTPVESGALRGTLTGLDVDAFAALTGNIYILKDNAIRPRTAGNWLSAERAYINYDALVSVSAAPVPAPGKKVKAMPMQPKVATDIDAINAADAPVKMVIDGKLYILRGEKMYDATGRLVK